MKHIIYTITVAIFFVTVIFSSCNDQNTDYSLAQNGVLLKVIEKGNDSTKASKNEIVTISLIYRIDDSIFFDSKNTENGTLTFPITEPLFKGDLYDALTLIGRGDSVSVAVPADSFYLKTAAMKRLPKNIEPGSYVYYEIRLHECETQGEFQKRMLEEARIKAKEEKIFLQNYLNNNKIYTDPTQSGLYFIEDKKGRGQTPDTGDMCQVYMSVKELQGDNILYSNFNDQPLDFEFGGTFDTKGFQEGVGLMKPGGKATLIVPSWIGVGSTGIEMVAPYTTLVYEVELLAIRTVEEVNREREELAKLAEIEKAILKKSEPNRIANYLEENNIDVEPTPSGLYFKIIESSSGPVPVDGDIVTLEYVHFDLEGNKLQSSYDDSTPFTYEVGTGAVIKGWEEAVKMMPKGSRAWLLIPSDLGYGEHRRVRNIKPYSPLVFELEVVNIQ